MKPLPPIRNARIYWRPHRGQEDRGGFYPVCLEEECNTLGAWSAQDGMATGESAYWFLVEHRKEVHQKEGESVAVKAAGLDTWKGILGAAKSLYKPKDSEPGAP